MGFACPVCEVPQLDGEHLAHHLAITASVHGDDHEAWLDRHVPDWTERGPDDLAPRVIEHAADSEVEGVFDDTVGDVIPHHEGEVTDPPLDDEVGRVLREARQLTERMSGGDRESARDS